ncbi:hypothetical protein CCY01nite_08600 [Chitinophaga cymbidii]|uniref:SGNH hydrolase-type esterase domain-containing protein n=2 Tax=Chitinophaga cymbidii TaxID=1096750 RepID=A0A512RFX0_9BACT|nr:GDSL-type esterase/lipase family protein [Chitinophaga cymbidii]GEP94600.1 hypothetical protein CCY01nite_08600 [Chitinophaga cymbidii]
MKSSAQTSRFLFNDTALYPLFEQLRRADSQVVSIFHLGDSHVQAGFLPEAAAAGLKQKFGDAGPGWVLPYNLARTNGPDAYRWSSHIRWSSVRVVERYQVYWPGPGGMTIHTSQVSPSLSCTIKQGSTDNIQIFYDAGTGKAPVQAVGDMEQLTVRIHEDSTAFPENMQQATITADSSIYAFRLSWPQHKGLFRFYGAVLQNGHQGVLYHAIGINGAQFMHYNQHAATLPVQLRILRPQLLILSLGTNEAFGGVTAAQLRQEMDKTMKAVREHAPGAKVLFTTPPYGMKKKRRVAYRKNKRTYYRVTYAANPQVAVLRAEILQYCRDNGYACWDFYDAMRADKRFLRGWSNDKLHFNAYGYTLQGTMLFETIAAAYDDWIKNLTDAFPGKPVERAEIQ